MAKSNSNGNGNGAGHANQSTVHLVLQGKGGVGKSLVASWLAEFLMSRGQPVRCIDGDPVNRSLGQYKFFGAEKIDLLNQSGVVERSRYDALVHRFLTEDAVFVVDSGATAFLPFWTYLVEADAVRTLRAAGRRVYIHVPISAGEMLNDTLLGSQDLSGQRDGTNSGGLDQWNTSGPVEREGKDVRSDAGLSRQSGKGATASVGLRQRNPEARSESTSGSMRESKLTFAVWVIGSR